MCVCVCVCVHVCACVCVFGVAMWVFVCVRMSLSVTYVSEQCLREFYVRVCIMYACTSPPACGPNRGST